MNNLFGMDLTQIGKTAELMHKMMLEFQDRQNRILNNQEELKRRLYAIEKYVAQQANQQLEFTNA